jgi:hypothetical protein
MLVAYGEIAMVALESTLLGVGDSRVFREA